MKFNVGNHRAITNEFKYTAAYIGLLNVSVKGNSMSLIYNFLLAKNVPRVQNATGGVFANASFFVFFYD